MLGTESKIQDAAKPLVQVMAGGLGDLVCCTQSHQRGPFLHRKRQRLCCMGRALPRAVSCHANAIYRSDIKWSTLLVTKVQTMGSFSWWLRAVQCLALQVLAPRLEIFHMCLESSEDHLMRRAPSRFTGPRY